jgi:hypothetical protein
MLVPAMVVYAAARRDKVRELRAGGVAAVVGIAAAVAFVPSFVGMPILSARESVLSMGDARTPGEVWAHLRGANYTDFKGAWGFDLARLALAASFIWEEFLGIGLVVLGIGLWRLGAEHRRVLLLLAAWTAPTFLLPLVFIGEGMFDQWFVVAYLALSFATAAGFAWILERWRVLFPAALSGAVVWMILMNFGDLYFRHYEVAEQYGRLLFRDLEPGATFVVSTDDTAVIPMYLQRVRGERPDVRIVHGEFVGLPWYDGRLERDFGVKRADLDAIRSRTTPQLLTVTAIANANVAPGKPVYSERPTDPRGLRPGLALAPAGVLWKTAVEAEAAPRLTIPDVDPFVVAGQRRRARGILMRHTSSGMVARFEPYENRLIGLLVQAKLRQTRPMLERDAAAALDVYEKALRIDPSLEMDCTFQYDLGLALYLRDRYVPAEAAFQQVLRLEPLPESETMANFYLAEIARATRRPGEAKRHYARALEINGAEPYRMKIIRQQAEQP